MPGAFHESDESVLKVVSVQIFLKNILGSNGFVQICLIFLNHPFLFEGGNVSNLRIFKWMAQPSTSWPFGIDNEKTTNHQFEIQISAP